MPWIIAILVILVLISALVSVVVYAIQGRRVGPNQALIVSGGERGTRVMLSGNTFVLPLLEKANYLSLEIHSVPFDVENVQTVDNRLLIIEATLQVKIPHQETAVIQAATHFLSKTQNEIADILANIAEGVIRQAVSKKRGDELENDLTTFTLKVQEQIAHELDEMGMVVVSFVIHNIVSEKSKE